MEIGQTIAGKYRLNRTLGSGGMASVWSATNVFTDREFAIKFLLPHVASTPEAARRFLLEAKASARINHPNIIEVIDVGQADDGALFLVMELLHGISLETAIRRQRPPMRAHDFLRLMVDVAQALAAAHARGVIHRDLKPSNVFLHTHRDGDRVAKVLDFGVSKFVDEDGGGGLTMVGTILGSPLYMSPEQAMGAEGIDGRTDVFAFGSILFEAFCGERAYAGQNLNALIVAIATTPPKRIEDAAPHLPQPLKDLVKDCMVTDKSRRLASFEAVVERLEPLIASFAESDLRLPLPRRSAVESASGGHGRAKRTSDRPPQSGSGTSMPPLSMPLPSAIPPRGTASTPGSLSWPATRGTSAETRGRPLPWLAGAAGIVVIGLLAAIGTGRVRTSAKLTPEGASASLLIESSQPPVTRSVAPGALPGAVPVIPVDDLPVAAHEGKGLGAASLSAKRNGRLSLAATPGECAIAIDGSPRGMTPLQSFEVPVGTHHLECAEPSGIIKTATVTVAEGAEAHYQFTLSQ